VSEARLIVPTIDDEPWPTLGPEVCDWIETYLCHGPGDVLGEPIELIDEVRLFIYRAYEVYPRDHELAGRRRFKRAALSRRKGFAKTEIAAFIACAEMDPNGPVRCNGWRIDRGEWIPVGVNVVDPYIPMVAVTEEQTEDLAYGAVYEILTRGPLADEYDVGLDRIQHRRAPGKIQALASAPSARDGARTTFQHFDETHLFVSQRLREAHSSMQRNIPKRYAADAWSLETTTMYSPGENSVAEGSHQYAEAVVAGRVEDPRLLFDHRQASERHELKKAGGLRKAIVEASGDAITYTDVEAIIGLFHDPQTVENDFRRFWLNQRRKSAARWVSLDSWGALALPERQLDAGARIVLGFDGSYKHDSTALVAATIEESPHVKVLKAWEKPLHASGTWRVPRLEVDAEIELAMERYRVEELICDPPGWHREIEDWASKYGEVVVEFDTNQATKFGPACDAFEQSVSGKGLTHDGSEVLTRHIGNCVAHKRGRHIVVEKSEPNSPDKIDAGVAAILAHSGARRIYVGPKLEPWAVMG
jgi:phage terminase large subunit-like protein